MNVRVSLLLVLLCLTWGCGDTGPSTYPVSGEISYQDNSIAHGSVTFAPKGGGDLIVVGINDTRYELDAPAGEYEVAVTATAEIAEGKAGFEQKVTRPPLPPKYSHPSRSGIVAVVKEQDLNTIDLHLK